MSFLKIEVFINISLIFKSNFSSGEHFSERAQYYHVIKNLSPKALSNYSVVTELFIQVLNQLQFVDFPSMSTTEISGEWKTKIMQKMVF